jgi:hypothetical protein
VSGEPPKVVDTHQSVWVTLRQAIMGSAIDFTTAPVGRAVVMLAVPMVMEMAMASIFAVAQSPKALCYCCSTL